MINSLSLSDQTEPTLRNNNNNNAHVQSCDLKLFCFSQIHSTDTTSVVLIPESKLNHSGRYIINAESPAGHKVVKVRVNVLGMYKYNDFSSHIPLDLSDGENESSLIRVRRLTTGYFSFLALWTCRPAWTSERCEGN